MTARFQPIYDIELYPRAVEINVADLGSPSTPPPHPSSRLSFIPIPGGITRELGSEPRIFEFEISSWRKYRRIVISNVEKRKRGEYEIR